MESPNDAGSLLNDKRVIEEINRHLWIESEKADYDIGFEKAKEDWLKNFSKAWMKYHMPDEARSKKAASKRPSPKTAGKTTGSSAKRSAAAKAKSSKTVAKRRRAKSYVK